ncbi:hypothetical protein [uncultured Thiodictyon sp.]|uniref:hypothetical protein n=1 Tax=uncultured Thiodictyon sp. TaxID=1846217 RepID=UPI0025F0158A|nr:hypothetical protein [uncultured Thiodictyon sp.]
MQAVRLNAVVGADSCLRIEVPAEIPTGQVEVIVLANDTTGVQAEQSLDELFSALDRMPHKRLTKEEADAYLAEERASWD